MSRPGSIAWFAAHELRLAWRDRLWVAVGPRRRRGLLISAAIFTLLVHGLAFGMLAPHLDRIRNPDQATLAAITVTLLLAVSVMLSQALETTTRAFYERADLDLILSSPAAAARLFAVRMVAIAGTTATTAVLLAAPFLNVLAWLAGPRWLAGYGVIAGLGMLATACGIVVTVAMFKAIGPRRTRVMAQIAAAVIGAAFLIGIQAIAVLSFGNLSRYAVLDLLAATKLFPPTGSVLWGPAQAVTGDGLALGAVLGLGAASLVGVTLAIAPGFARFATASASVVTARNRSRERLSFIVGSPRAALRQKEWLLLKRDPWLLSQSLMQILYLIPPALLLWFSFGQQQDTLVLLIPVLVMAAGQLAGGIAWLSVSGEDAPDLIQTAPLGRRQILRSKIEAVLCAVALVFAPLVGAAVMWSPFAGLCMAVGIAAATASATAIQLWFQAQAKRSHFRRRQTSSRVATLAEAFSSIAWAGTAALCAAGTWLALPTALLAGLTLFGAWTLRPTRVR